MAPFLQSGDRVSLRAPVFPLHNGRCYAYVHESNIVIHRLVSHTETRATFIADNSDTRHAVSVDAVIGELADQRGGYQRLTIQTINCIFLYIFGAFPKIRKMRKKCIGIIMHR